MKRRDFCKTVPCAALAAANPAFLNGTYSQAKAISPKQTPGQETDVNAFSIPCLSMNSSDTLASHCGKGIPPDSSIH